MFPSVIENIYIILLAAIILMLLDYYLTIVGYHFYLKYAQKHLNIEKYELNPRLQEAIKSKKLFNPRHLMRVILVSGLLFLIWLIREHSDLTRKYYQFIVGLVFLPMFYVNFLHLDNILSFKRYPGNVEGRISYSNIFSLKTLRTRVCYIGIILIGVYLLIPEYVLLGGAFGFFTFALAITSWITKVKKSSAKLEKR